MSLKGVENHMGKLIRSENSLNQHIKLKHEELWNKLKTVDFNQMSEFNKKYPDDSREEIQGGSSNDLML